LPAAAGEKSEKLTCSLQGLRAKTGWFFFLLK